MLLLTAHKIFWRSLLLLLIPVSTWMLYELIAPRFSVVTIISLDAGWVFTVLIGWFLMMFFAPGFMTKRMSNYYELSLWDKIMLWFLTAEGLIGCIALAANALG